MTYKSLLLGMSLAAVPAVSHAQDATSVSLSPEVSAIVGDRTLPVMPGVPFAPFVSTPEFEADWGLAAIGADKAIEAGFTGAGVRVGVVDMSIQLTHPEFAGRADTYQYNDIDDGTHGTHVAGTIGAAQDGTGMQGVAPGVLLSSIRIFEPSGAWISSQTVADGYDGAIAAGIRIFNNSWGSAWDVTQASVTDAENHLGVELDAYRRAVEADAVLVWSAGNAHFANAELYAGLPYLFPELKSNWIAVASVDQALELSSFSSACGVAAMWCVSAPGTDIYSTLPVDTYGTLSGTSMAAPHVTGAVAIAKEIFPEASGSELAQVVLQTATDIGDAGVDDIYGWGLLNLGNVVDMIDPQTASFFASAAWSRFGTLDHVASAIPHVGVGAATLTDADLSALAAAYWPADGGAAQPGSAKGGGHPLPGMWAVGLYGASDLAAGPSNPGANSQTTGVLFGVDLAASDMQRVGIAAGYSKTNLDGDVFGDHADESGYHLLAYGDWKGDGWFASGVAQIAYFDQSMTRFGISGSQGTSATPAGVSSPTSWGGELGGRAGHAWSSQGYEVAPYVAGVVRWQETDAFTETGAGIFSLTVPSSSLAQFEIGPGVRFVSREAEVGQMVARAALDIGYSYLGGDRDHQTTVSLLGTGITGNTAEVGAHILKIGADIEMTASNGTTSGVISYDGRFQGNASLHTISAGIRQAF